jgi:hypothetical protein
VPIQWLLTTWSAVRVRPGEPFDALKGHTTNVGAPFRLLMAFGLS